MSFSKSPLEAGVIYNGPSLLDGKPIIVVATATSNNAKTGTVLQTYILREDMDPRDANKTGEDFSICGNCLLKGKPTDSLKKKLAKDRACYVTIGHGPLNVWRSYQRGTVYPTVYGHDAIAALGAGYVVRLGTYGDPSAVPSYIWDSLLSRAASHTGYSHQASTPGADHRPDLVMTSAETLADAQAAWRRAERTFRIVSSYDDIQTGQEIACPADTKGITCNSCRLCGGASVAAKSIAIVAHGNGSRFI